MRLSVRERLPVVVGLNVGLGVIDCVRVPESDLDCETLPVAETEGLRVELRDCVWLRDCVELADVVTLPLRVVLKVWVWLLVRV